MRPETFEFDAEVVGAADDRHARSWTRLNTRSAGSPPDELDLSTTTATIDDGVLFVALTHRSQDDQLLAASVGSDEAVVYFGVEHEHFWPDDPANGRLWPIDAPDHAAAAGALVQAVLAGRVEREVRDGLLMQRVASYLVDDDGNRNVITRSGTFRLRRGPAGAKLVRFDFGVTGS